jgi:hypothetical protein
VENFFAETKQLLFLKKINQKNFDSQDVAPTGGKSWESKFFCLFFVHKKEDSFLSLKRPGLRLAHRDMVRQRADNGTGMAAGGEQATGLVRGVEGEAGQLRGP